MEIKDKIEEHFNTFFEISKNVEFSIKSDNVTKEKWFIDVLKYLTSIKNNKNKLFFLGNGASASISAHFSADFTKNALIPSFSNIEGAFLTCFSNDYGYENAYTEMLKRLMAEGDGLIIISSSGSSRNLINALNFAKNTFKESKIITFTSFRPNNVLKLSGDYNLYLPSKEYSFAESGHAYYLHLLTDLLCNQTNTIEANQH